MRTFPRIAAYFAVRAPSPAVVHGGSGAARARSHAAAATLAALLSIAAPAHSTLTLTAAGTNLGFTASTFVSGLADIITEGPFGLALTGNDRVLVSDFASGTRSVFADVDNQTLANAFFTVPSGSGAQGYASGVGAAYGGNGANFVRFNDNGTEAAVLVPGVTPALGVAADPASGHLIATSSRGLIDIDPVANSFRVIRATLASDADGVSLSPDGSVAYVGFFSSGHVIGYRVADGSIAFDSGNIGHFPDGTGVIVSSNSLNGKIIVNGEDGSVGLIDPSGALGNYLLIAQNQGQRGDYVAADRSNGSLLLDYSTEVDRLACGPNCAIGGVPPVAAVPEPETYASMLAGLGLLAFTLGLRRHPSMSHCRVPLLHV
jgi:PEP-CTERM motif-containing protein